jgi:hypothetical protein
MNNNPDEVLKSIPDYDDLMKLTEEITGLMYKKLSLDAEIKIGEANVFRVTSTEPQYQQGGKAPAVSYVENTFKFSGLNGELVVLREELAKATAELEGKKMQMDIYKQMVEIWRTLCSNSRTASF